MKRTYEIWRDGKKTHTTIGEIKELESIVAKGIKPDETIFFCRLAKMKLKIVSGLHVSKGKLKRIPKDELQWAFDLAIENKSRTGPKKRNGGGETAITVGISKEEKEKFETYASKFTDGNKSEMFRRMFKAWEGMMEQVIGKQGELK